MPGRSEDLVTHFVEQDGWVTLLVMGTPAAIFVGLLAITVAAVRPLRDGQGGRLLAVVAISLGALVLALTIYESLALYFRSVPRGSGLERQSGYDAYVTWTRAIFIALNVLIVAGTGLLGRRLLGSWRWAAAAAAVIVTFMVVTLPFVDFLTECNVGVPLIDWGVQRC